MVTLALRQQVRPLLPYYFLMGSVATVQCACGLNGIGIHGFESALLFLFSPPFFSLQCTSIKGYDKVVTRWRRFQIQGPSKPCNYLVTTITYIQPGHKVVTTLRLAMEIARS